MNSLWTSTLTGCLIVWCGLLVSACGECVDCHRQGPPVGYVRASAVDEAGGPVPGVSVHLDNREYVVEPQVTGADGAVVLVPTLGTIPSDTATVTAFPPSGYQNPPARQVTLTANDTVEVTFTLLPE